MKPSNRLGLDYRAESTKFPKRTLIDIHSHINGDLATRVYRESAELYGVEHTFSMTALEQVDIVRSVLGNSLRVIATPNFLGKDKVYEVGPGYRRRLEAFAAKGAVIAKFWNAPRIYDGVPEPFRSNPLRLDDPARIETMKVARDLGMYFMVHVSDPDTWFKTKYINVEKYGTKEQQYEPLRKMLSLFEVPTIAAHMGGSPEDLNFLSQLLHEHPHLYLDCSATKWIVRELSKHSRETLHAFFTRWSTRILFGSDIVTTDAHLTTEATNEMAIKSDNADDAFDLYASRYWALRTLFETDYDGESPIADPDLNLVEPHGYSELDAPRLRGMSLPVETLERLYFRNAAEMFGI